jgi:hypothetical protein
MTNQKPNNKKVVLVIFLLLIILIPAIWFLFLNKGSDFEKASEKLTGKWLRADGPYTIEIKSVINDSVLEVGYFNPNPIPEVQGSWRMFDDKLKVSVVLNDQTYQGSFYDLTYNERSKNLVGTFYQARVKQAFDVYFTRK